MLKFEKVSFIITTTFSKYCFANICTDSYVFKITRSIIRLQWKLTASFSVNWNHPHKPLITIIIDINLWSIWIIPFKFLYKKYFITSMYLLHVHTWNVTDGPGIVQCKKWCFLSWLSSRITCGWSISLPPTSNLYIVSSSAMWHTVFDQLHG